MRIAVYCSASDDIPEAFLKQGDRLGRWLARNGHTLVFGGATGGLMSRISLAAQENGGKIIGVVPERIIHSGRKCDWCSELIVVGSMAERKQKMRELADAFICMPGSYGTMDEMMDVLASGTVGEHHKPCFIFNYRAFYSRLISLAAQMKRLHFIPQEESYTPTVLKSLDEIFLTINTLTQ